MRFYGTLRFNGYVVGKGYGCNKKQVKQVASRVALMNLVPSLYREWKRQQEPHGSPALSETTLVNSNSVSEKSRTTTPCANRVTSPPGQSLEKLKENIVPKRLFNELQMKGENAEQLLPAQQFIERGFFDARSTAEEAKISAFCAEMEVDESSCSSNEELKEIG